MYYSFFFSIRLYIMISSTYFKWISWEPRFKPQSNLELYDIILYLFSKNEQKKYMIFPTRQENMYIPTLGSKLKCLIFLEVPSMRERVWFLNKIEITWFMILLLLQNPIDKLKYLVHSSIYKYINSVSLTYLPQNEIPMNTYVSTIDIRDMFLS